MKFTLNTKKQIRHHGFSLFSHNMSSMKNIRRILRYVLIFFGSIVAFLLVYLLGAFVFSKIGVDSWPPKHKKEITLYLLNNGVHTDIVMPASNSIKNWENDFPPENTRKMDSTAQFLSIGWGDKGFYLETPSWGELKFSTAFKAAFALSSAAVHTTYYYELPKNEEYIPFQVSEKQYRLLVKYIEHSLKRKEDKPIFISTNAVYGDHDAFYEATGSYSLFHTCNTWVNNALKACGQKACLWTPFAGSIFDQYKK